MEATRRPELAEILRANGAVVRGAVADRLQGADIADPERAAGEVLALLDGIMLNRLTGLGAPQLDDEALRVRVERLLVAVGA